MQAGYTALGPDAKVRIQGITPNLSFVLSPVFAVLPNAAPVAPNTAAPVGTVGSTVPAGSGINGANPPAGSIYLPGGLTGVPGVSSIIFAVAEGDLRENGDMPDNNDTESGGGKLNKAGLVQVETNFTAHRQADIPIHALVGTGALNNIAGLNLFFGSWCFVLLYPYGLSRQTYVMYCLTQEFSSSFRVEGSAVQTIRAAFRSQGSFLRPTD
jgi:hypothetical protein